MPSLLADREAGPAPRLPQAFKPPDCLRFHRVSSRAGSNKRSREFQAVLPAVDKLVGRPRRYCF